MNKQQLVSRVAETAEITKASAAKAVEAFFEAIREELQSGGTCNFVGFGSFKVAQRKAQTLRNPQTGKPMKVAARKVPKFVAGKGLKEAVN
ncbi:MAG: HU family DNA-binding protein [Alphaproteobacteria bacterium]|nr:HU family DNA-binding protein [Alphaproteobacteria bacterium]